jgi:hypothetical protein
MSDSVIYIRDPKTGDLVPIKAYDNGDSTYTAWGVDIVTEEAQDGG